MVSDRDGEIELNDFECLNPCCNGRWSLTHQGVAGDRCHVLILVVMEDGL